MSQCVQIIQNPDGSLTLMPDSKTDLQSCSYVLQSGAEVGNSLTYLTPSQGLEISIYVMALWAGAWGIKQLVKVLNSGDVNEILD